MTIDQLQDLCSYDNLKKTYKDSYVKVYVSVISQFTDWFCKRKYFKEIEENDCIEFLEENGISLKSGVYNSYHQNVIKGIIVSLITYIKTGKIRVKHCYSQDEFIGEFKDPFCTFLKEIKENKSLSTYDNYRLIIARFNRYLASNKITEIKALSPKHIENYFLKQLEESEGKKNNLNNTVLRLFLNYLYENNYLERDLSLFVPKTKSIKDKKIPTTLSSEEVLNLFAAIERNSSVGKRDYAIILFLAVYGCRVSDLCNLRLSNINWKTQKISFTQHKTSIPIEYELYDFIGEALADYLYYVRAKTTYVGDEVFITLSSNPGPINRSYVYNMLVMYLKRAGVENLDLRKHGPHLLRFTLATRLIEKNVDISYVKSQLGHKHTDITHNYIRLDKNNLSQCVLPTPKCVSRLYLSYMED